MVPLPPLAKRVILGLLLLMALVFLWLIRQVLGPFLVALLLVYLLNPLVDWLSARKLGRWTLGRSVAVAGVFLGMFGILGLASLILVPNLYAEGVRITRDMPQLVREFEGNTLLPLIARVQSFCDMYGIPFQAQESFKGFFGSLLHSGQGETVSFLKQGQDLVRGVFSTVYSALLVFMLTMFMLMDWQRLKIWTLNVIPAAYRPVILSLGGDIDRGLSGAVRGQLIVCLINGALTTLGLVLLHIKFALTIGLIAGVFSLIPIFGTVISTVPAVLIALTQGWLTAFEVVGLIILIHLIEANILNPNVVGHHSELHPVLVLLSLMVGEHVAGTAGLLFAVPVAAVARALVRFAYQVLVEAPDAVET